jgi:hypothetical protein
LRDLQVGADRRQRDVHDRCVEYDDELRHGEEREGEPTPRIWSLGSHDMPFVMKHLQSYNI